MSAIYKNIGLKPSVSILVLVISVKNGAFLISWKNGETENGAFLISWKNGETENGAFLISWKNDETENGTFLILR